jgi:hypothetical protein
MVLGGGVLRSGLGLGDGTFTNGISAPMAEALESAWLLPHVNQEAAIPRPQTSGPWSWTSYLQNWEK